jgi:hypothetical protein
LRPSRAGDPLSGTLYVSALVREDNIGQLFERKFEQIIEALSNISRDSVVAIRSASATSLQPITTDSIDYVFTDPPFGQNIFYADESNEPFGRENKSEKVKESEYIEYDTILNESEVITSVSEFTDRSMGLFGRRLIKLLKIFIGTVVFPSFSTFANDHHLIPISRSVVTKPRKFFSVLRSRLFKIGRLSNFGVIRLTIFKPRFKFSCNIVNFIFYYY